MNVPMFQGKTGDGAGWRGGGDMYKFPFSTITLHCCSLCYKCVFLGEERES